MVFMLHSIKRVLFIYGADLTEEACAELQNLLPYFTTMECETKVRIGGDFFSGMAAAIALRSFTGVSFVANLFTTIVDYDVDSLIRAENNEEIPRAQIAMLKIDELIRDGAEINVRHSLHYGAAILKARPELGIDFFEAWHEGTAPANPSILQQTEAAGLQAANDEDLAAEPLDDIAAAIAIALIDHHRATAGVGQLVRYAEVPHEILVIAQFLLRLNLK